MKRVLVAIEGVCVFALWLLLLLAFLLGVIGDEFYNLEDLILRLVYGELENATAEEFARFDFLASVMGDLFDEDFYGPVFFLFVILSLIYGISLYVFRATFMVAILWMILRLDNKTATERRLAACRLEVCGWAFVSGFILLFALFEEDLTYLYYLAILILPNAFTAYSVQMPLLNGLFREPAKLADSAVSMTRDIGQRLGDGPSGVAVEIVSWTVLCLVVTAFLSPDMGYLRFDTDPETLRREHAFWENLRLVAVLSIIAFVLTYLMFRRSLPLADLIRACNEQQADAPEGSEHVLVVQLRKRAGQLRLYALVILSLMVAALVVAVSIFVLAESFGSKQDSRAIVLDEIVDAERRFQEYQRDFMDLARQNLSAPDLSEELLATLTEILDRNRDLVDSLSEIDPIEQDREYNKQLEEFQEGMRKASEELDSIERLLEGQVVDNERTIVSVFRDSGIQRQIRLYREAIETARGSISTLSQEMQRDFWNDRSFVESLVTRFGALIILFTAVQILGGRYESLLNRAAEYDAIADSLSIAVTETPDKLKDLTLQEIIEMTRVLPLRTKQALTPVDRLLDGLQNVAMAFGSVKSATEQTIRNVRRRQGRSGEGAEDDAGGSGDGQRGGTTA